MSNENTAAPKPLGIIRLATVENVAQAWQTSEATVRRWCREHRIPAVKTPGGEWRFRVEDLNRVVGE